MWVHALMEELATETVGFNDQRVRDYLALSLPPAASGEEVLGELPVELRPLFLLRFQYQVTAERTAMGADEEGNALEAMFTSRLARKYQVKTETLIMLLHACLIDHFMGTPVGDAFLNSLYAFRQDWVIVLVRHESVH